MEAVILCGGRGSRLAPFTESCPKPLIKVLNIPILDRILDMTKKLGVQKTHLSLGYQAQEIISHCELRNDSVSLIYHIEDHPLGTAGGVKNCVPQTEDALLVLSGDNIFDFDLSEAIRSHESAQADITIVGIKVKDPREYGIMETEKDGRITGFLEKPGWENVTDGPISTGIYIIEEKALARIPERRQFDFAKDLFPALLRENYRLYCYSAKGIWADLGEPSSLLSFSKEFLMQKDKKIAYRGTLIENDQTTPDGAQIIAPCLIGEGAVLQKNAKLGPYAVLGKNCEIGESVSVSNSMLGDGTKLEEQVEVRNSIMAERVHIFDHTVVEDNVSIGSDVEIGRFSRIRQNVRIWPGNRIPPESVLTADLLYGKPKYLETDAMGVEGAPFTEVSLSDAVKIGHALGSLSEVRRIGVGISGGEICALFKDACIAGIRAAGVIVYDFEEIFSAQTVFYSGYCSLDAFVHIRFDGERIGFRFSGKNGLPVALEESRTLNRIFRFSSFRYAPSEAVGDYFRMHLLSTAYYASLKKVLGLGRPDRRIRLECDNPLVKEICEKLFPNEGSDTVYPELQIMINPHGTDLYCLENGMFYQSTQIRTLLADTALNDDPVFPVPEEAPFIYEELARKHGKVLVRLYQNGQRTETPDLQKHLWCFDALFLACTFIRYLSDNGLTVKEALIEQPKTVSRQETVDLDSSPANVRSLILSTGATKEKGADNPYYGYHSPSGTIKIRQLGNSAKVRILVEAAGMEAAKELVQDVKMRLDNKSNS